MPPPGLSGFQESGKYLPENNLHKSPFNSKGKAKLLLL